MRTMPKVFVIDDNDTLREGMAVTLTKSGHQVSAFRSGVDAVAAYAKASPDVVVTDLKMDAMDGLEVVRQIKALDDKAVVLLVTAFGTVETAVDAMKLGAYDFITKPFSPDVLRAKVASALELSLSRHHIQKLEARNDLLSAAASPTGTLLIGDSEPMQRLREQARRAAATEATVHLHGESGTGKELVAKLLHELSPRKTGPFIVTHCAALAETLLESELFGHERGSFTGAVKRKLGRFELADGGTLFLDEIGELTPNVQTKLLRVLQEREIQRVGGEETVKVDVRVISATHRDLKKEVDAGRFREDLFYRLHIVPLTIPPLRERPEDIPMLAAHFLAKHAPRMNSKAKALSPEATKALLAYAWPGNVREVENAVEQALVFGEGAVVEAKDLPAFLQSPQTRAAMLEGGLPTPHGDRPLPDILEDIERELIRRAYEKAGKVKTETARLLGIKTSALYYKLEKYGFIAAGSDKASETAP